MGGGLIGLVILASLIDYRRKGLLMFLTMSAGLFGLGIHCWPFPSLSICTFSVLVNAGSPRQPAWLLSSSAAHAVDTLYKTLMQSVVARRAAAGAMAMGAWVP